MMRHPAARLGRLRFPAALLLLLAAAASDSSALETRPMRGTDAPARAKREIYKIVDGLELAIYLYFPEGWKPADRRPAIVFYSGGSWRWSGPSQFIRHCEYLSSRGMVAAAAHFRVGAGAPFTPAWSVEDAKSTVRWLRTNASRLGIDPERIVTSGFSSGAHMAACTAMCAGFEAAGEDLSVSSVPNAMVLVNPPMGWKEDLEGRVGRLGMSKEEWRAIEPNRGLRKGLPPAFVVYGTKDWLLPGGRDFIAGSKKLGNVVDVMMVEGQEHGFAKKSPWHEKVMLRIDRFLAGLGYVEGEPTVVVPAGRPAEKPGTPVVLEAGPIESWEDGGSLPWESWDATVQLDVVDRATDGKWGARMRFDSGKYEWPVMYHSPAAPRDLGGLKRLTFDVLVPDELAGRVRVEFRVNRGKEMNAAPASPLKKGWNELSVDLAGEWLSPEVRREVTKMSWLVVTDRPGTRGELVFDNLRAE